MMFELLIGLGIVGLAGGGFLTYVLGGTDYRKYMPLSIGAIVIGLILTIAAFNTAGAQLKIKQFFASGKGGQWLVIDNSGGKTMRHWLLDDGYVEAHAGGAGWQFYDASGNLCYIGGDSYVMQIHEPMADFLKSYHAKYNIPADAQALK